MRTTGKRTLAGIAAGALAFAGLAFVAAPSAQAAQTTAAYCVGNGTGVNGSAGNGVDPTTVQPNCSLTAAIGPAGQTSVGSSTFIGSTTQWVRMTISGDSTWDDTNPLWRATALPVITGSGKVITLPASYLTSVEAGNFLNGSNDDSAVVNVPTAGIRTISVETSATVSTTIPPNNQFVARGDFTVTGLGGSATALVSQAYYAVAPANATTPIGIVHVVDEAGNVIPTTGGAITNIVSNASGGTVDDTQYLNGDCKPDGTLKPTVNHISDPGNTAGVGIVTDACASVLGARVSTQSNSGLWITLQTTPATAPGNYTATFVLALPNGATYPGSITYTVSSPVAGAWTMSFDKSSYEPGAIGTATFSLTDLGGRIVPDGLGWLTGAPRATGASNDDSRSVDAGFNNALARSTWAYADDTDNMPTYNGKNFLEFLVPGTQMDVFTLVAEAEINAGWASTQQGTLKSASASIINPTPPPFGTIMIEGTRGVGDDANRVYVEGTTTNLVGSSVTPYFRFPGETGFTAGTGVRTVDAQGNFNWQRKTGKKIAIQFREQNITSNTVIIEAK